MHNLVSCCLIVVILLMTASVGLAYDGVVDLFRVADSNGYNTAEAGVRNLTGITWYPVCTTGYPIVYSLPSSSFICERAGFTSAIGVLYTLPEGKSQTLSGIILQQYSYLNKPYLSGVLKSPLNVTETGSIWNQARVLLECESSPIQNVKVDKLPLDGVSVTFNVDLRTPLRNHSRALHVDLNNTTPGVFLRYLNNFTSMWYTIGTCSSVEKVFCMSSDPNKYPVRLSGGRDNSSGRLEIHINGVWGTVCDDEFGITEATVVCQQLGFKSLGSVYTRYIDASTTDPILLDDVQCHGGEPHLVACRHARIGTNDCRHREDVHVNCSSQELMLVGGIDERRGRLETKIGNTRGSVCDDGFNLQAASVVCRQLGFTEKPAQFLTGTVRSAPNRIWLDEVRCFGNETHLWDCEHNPWGVNDCSHSEDVFMECPLADDYTLRLRGGSANKTSVILEMKLGGSFRPLCGSINQIGAELACQQMGYPSNMVGIFNRGYCSDGLYPRVVYDINCNALATSFGQCSFRPLSTNNHKNIVIACGEVGMSARLMDGPNANSGRLEVSVGDVWGTVCDDDFDNKAAEVACRQLGLPFTSARVVTSGYGHSSGQIWLDNVQCTGEETNLLLCQHSPIGTSDCRHSEDVSITCSRENNNVGDYPVRLVGGTSTRGRVEVSIGGQWGTVCNDRFDSDAAKVVCRQLGYSGGAKIDYSHYPPATGEILLDDVRCMGHESSLKYCSHNAPGINDCSHSEDVAVKCEDPTENPMTVVGAVLGSIAGALVIAGLSCYCRSKSLNRRRVARITRRQARSLSQSLHYTLTVQYNNATGNLQTGPMAPGRVIIPPSSPGIYAGPPSYDQLFPNGETVVSPSTDDSSPPPYPGLTTPAVFTVPTDSVPTTVSTAPAAPTVAE